MSECKNCSGTGKVKVMHITGQVFNMAYELIDVIEERVEDCPHCHGTGSEEEK